MLLHEFNWKKEVLQATEPALVDFWALWCGPCQAAMPNNDRVFKKYADQGVVLIGVTADDTRGAYDGWVERNASIRWPEAKQ